MTALSDCLGPPGSGRYGRRTLDLGDLRRLQLLTTTTTRDCRRDVCRRPPGTTEYSPHLESGRCALEQKRRAVQLAAPVLLAGIIADARSASRNGVFEIYRGAAQPQVVHICLCRSLSVSGFRWCWLGKFCVDPFTRPHHKWIDGEKTVCGQQKVSFDAGHVGGDFGYFSTLPLDPPPSRISALFIVPKNPATAVDSVSRC